LCNITTAFPRQNYFDVQKWSVLTLKVAKSGQKWVDLALKLVKSKGG